VVVCRSNSEVRDATTPNKPENLVSDLRSWTVYLVTT
jgi:hypothetical protein